MWFFFKFDFQLARQGGMGGGTFEMEALEDISLVFLGGNVFLGIFSNWLDTCC